MGQFDPKFQVEGGVPHLSMCSKNYMNLPFMWYKNLRGTFVPFVTIHACDGQTDACMQRGKKSSILYHALDTIRRALVSVHSEAGNTQLSCSGWTENNIHYSFTIGPYVVCAASGTRAAPSSI